MEALDACLRDDLPPLSFDATPAPVKPPRISGTTPLPTPPSKLDSKEAFRSAFALSDEMTRAVQAIMTVLLNAPGPTNPEHARLVLAELIKALGRLENEALSAMRRELSSLDADLFCRTHNLFKTIDRKAFYILHLSGSEHGFVRRVG